MEPSRPTDPRDMIRETLDDHRECMQVVAAVESCLDRKPDAEGAWLSALRKELTQLSETLRCHFTEEQEGPIYRSMPVQFPRYAQRLRKLEAEHAQIIRQAEDVLQRAGELRDPELHELREFNARVQMLVAMIRRHEAEENEIVLSANWNEVGVGD